MNFISLPVRLTIVRQMFKLKEEMVKIPEKNMQETLCIRNKSTLPMEEKISKAEEEYSNFDKSKEMTMYAVNLDYLQ